MLLRRLPNPGCPYGGAGLGVTSVPLPRGLGAPVEISSTFTVSRQALLGPKPRFGFRGRDSQHPSYTRVGSPRFGRSRTFKKKNLKKELNANKSLL